MEKLLTSSFRLGIISGGQLGKMLAQAASRWDLKTHIMDPLPDCPAASVCTHWFKGDATSYASVYEFGKSVDMLTFELENVNVEALQELKSEGLPIHPDPDVLALIQDKGLQKHFYKKHNIPTSRFTLYESRRQILAEIETGTILFPFVQKARREGYDGRGVVILRSEEDLPSLLDTPSVIEDAVDVEKELSVVVARNRQGQIEAFPVVEMEFSPEANLVEKLICPSRISPALQDRATELSREIAEEIGIEGILAVELFLDKAGNLWVNEVAPRPHNSGHHTIESAFTSQYEQHLRAILGVNLGSTELKCPSVMVNLLGEPGYQGAVRYEGVAELMKIPGVSLHIYGKRQTRPYRKMGHVTIVAPTLEEALQSANSVRERVKVISWQTQ